jgi:hypothetical protein
MRSGTQARSSCSRRTQKTSAQRPHEREQQLSLEIEERLAARLAGDRDRRRGHHHEPEQHDPEHEGEQHGIDADRTAARAGAREFEVCGDARHGAHAASLRTASTKRVPRSP